MAVSQTENHHRKEFLSFSDVLVFCKVPLNLSMEKLKIKSIHERKLTGYRILKNL